MKKKLTSTISLAALLLAGTTFADDTPPKIKELIESLQAAKVKNIDEAVPMLVKKYGNGFTGTSHSGAQQGDRRLVIYGDDAQLVLGLGEDDDSLELVEDVGGKLVPYTLSLEPDKKAKKPYTLTAATTECASCHKKDFRYIWDHYPKWRNFHGEFDDMQTAGEAEWKAFRKIPRFKPFFDQQPDDLSFPYQNNHKRSVAVMPNTRLGLFLGRRAARAFHQRITEKYPDRYGKYKYFLMRLFLDCSETDDEFTVLDKDMKIQNPRRQKQWENVRKTVPSVSSVMTKTMVRVQQLVDFLGVPPDGVIQEIKWETADAIEDPEVFFERFSNDFEYSAHPYSLTIGDGFLNQHVENFISKDIDDPMLNKYKKLSDYGYDTGGDDDVYKFSNSKKLDTISRNFDLKEGMRDTCASLKKQSETALGIKADPKLYPAHQDKDKTPPAH